MNRENKRRQYEKGYYKTHACDESFTCKNCGRLVVPVGAGSDHRNHCPNCLHSLHVDIEPGDRESKNRASPYGEAQLVIAICDTENQQNRQCSFCVGHPLSSFVYKIFKGIYRKACSLVRKQA